jgi:hypothetical protein
MATTRLVNGVMREYWRRDDAQGAGAANIDTDIRISAGQLSRVQGFLSIANVAGVPTFTVGTSIVNGRLRVTVTNGGGGTGMWDLDVALVQSSDQGKRAGVGYIMITNATPGLVGPQTLAQTYVVGAAWTDQVMTIRDIDGGGVIVDASTAAATIGSGMALEVRQNDLDIPLPFRLARRGDFANPAALVFEKCRGTYTPMAPADVQAADMMGCIDWYARVNGTMTIGAQIIATVLSVAGDVLDGTLDFYVSSGSISTLAFRFDTQGTGTTPRGVLYADGEIVPSANNTGRFGIAAAAWASAYIYTVNVAANICMNGVAAGGGAAYTVVFTNGATLPAVQADQVYLGAVDFQGDSSVANLAALALTTEEPLLPAGEEVHSHLVPITITDASGTHSYYLMAVLNDPQA